MNKARTHPRRRAELTLYVLCLVGIDSILYGGGCSHPRSYQETQARNTVSTGPEDAFSGERWLTWDQSSRVAFVMGNLRGYWDGQASGCADAKRETESLTGSVGMTAEMAEQMTLRCMNRFRPAHRSFDSYEKVVTEFYTKYPEDRFVEIQELIKLLAYDSTGSFTADNLHASIRISPAQITR